MNSLFALVYFFISPISAEWHAALMDFGSLVCTKISPAWDVCPLTIAGLNASAYKIPTQKRRTKSEPGRMVGTTFIPNRIFRGRIVQFLREHTSGAKLHTVGVNICIDWNPLDHTQWLQNILDVLIKDSLVRVEKNLYFLA